MKTLIIILLSLTSFTLFAKDFSCESYDEKGILVKFTLKQESEKKANFRGKLAYIEDGETLDSVDKINLSLIKEDYTKDQDKYSADGGWIILDKNKGEDGKYRGEFHLDDPEKENIICVEIELR